MTATSTARDERFEATVLDGGALGAVAIEIATRAAIAGCNHADLVSPALLDLLLGAVRPGGRLTQGCGGPPPETARELMIAGPARALYCTVLERGELVVLAAPVSMSVALGWALVRTLTALEIKR
jgi:hypothetical protein